MLSRVANCIMNQYPDGKRGAHLHINMLRSIAVFVQYGDLDLLDNPDIGTAFPEGMIATNCLPIRELNLSPLAYAMLRSSAPQKEIPTQKPLARHLHLDLRSSILFIKLQDPLLEVVMRESQQSNSITVC